MPDMTLANLEQEIKHVRGQIALEEKEVKNLEEQRIAAVKSEATCVDGFNRERCKQIHRELAKHEDNCTELWLKLRVLEGQKYKLERQESVDRLFNSIVNRLNKRFASDAVHFGQHATKLPQIVQMVKDNLWKLYLSNAAIRELKIGGDIAFDGQTLYGSKLPNSEQAVIFMLLDLLKDQSSLYMLRAIGEDIIQRPINNVVYLRQKWRKRSCSQNDCRTYKGQPLRNMVTISSCTK